MSILLQDLLEKIHKDTEKRVRLTVKRINKEVREAVRRETGLILNRQDSDDRSERNVSVPVDIVPGLPKVLQDMQFDNDLLLKISPYRRELEMVKSGLKGVKSLLGNLNHRDIDSISPSDKGDHINITNDVVDSLLKLLDKESPVKKILSVNVDILGAYMYKVPSYSVHNNNFPQYQNARIELYWGVIGLIAGMLAVNIESLTAVVLIHEIAHAYTHLGADIDGERWDSRDFANSKCALKEGLAQYYTYLISKRVDNKIIGTYKAYELLLKEQPDDYHSHEGMIDGYKAEEIRLSLLGVRRRKCESTMENFFDLLAKAKTQLRS